MSGSASAAQPAAGGDLDIAAGAKAFLAKQALKSFTPAEQAAFDAAVASIRAASVKDVRGRGLMCAFDLPSTEKRNKTIHAMAEHDLLVLQRFLCLGGGSGHCSGLGFGFGHYFFSPASSRSRRMV